MKLDRLFKNPPATLVIAGALFTFLGFCILTNSSGLYRKYADSSIPFIYQLNSSTPSNYITPIERAHAQWNNVQASYWVFNRGASSPITAAVQDGVNLVFFDIAGVNFPPPTNVIAFSRTYTTTAGGYRALESDLVWNARDFPPSPTGQPGQQDLQGVMAHEFGHHLGLGHQGTPGSPPGCGLILTQAVMYGTSSAGDTTKRHLHIHDVGGVASIYPVWRLEGTVTYSGQPLSGVAVNYVGTYANSVGPVETPNGTTWERPGDVATTKYTNTSGFYSNIVLDQIFSVVVDGFGYERDSAYIQFNPPGGIGQTQVIVRNFQLQPTPAANLAGTVRDANTLAPVRARLEFYGFGDPNGLTTSTITESNGSFSVSVPSKEFYRIVVFPAAPYLDKVELQSIYLPPGGTSHTFDVSKAQVLIVDDDAGSSYQESYQSSIDRLGFVRRTFSIADSAGALGGVLASFTQPPVLVWFTGNDTTNALTSTERTTIINHLTAGGRIILTGQNIAQFSTPGDPLLAGRLGIQFVANSPALFLRGFTGDVIGDGISGWLFSGGAGNQNSKDILSIVGGSTGVPTKTLYYGSSINDTANIAGVRVLGPSSSWAATYFAFGLEGLIPARQDTLIVRSFRFFDNVTSVGEGKGGKLPVEYSLSQNYPNPFNPSTTIRFGLPTRSFVSLKVFDILGRQVGALAHQSFDAGYHDIVLDATGLATGVYLYRLEASGSETGVFVQTQKMIILR